MIDPVDGFPFVITSGTDLDAVASDDLLMPEINRKPIRSRPDVCGINCRIKGVLRPLSLQQNAAAAAKKTVIRGCYGAQAANSLADQQQPQAGSLRCLRKQRQLLLPH